jgi:hypothetical protein
MKRKVTKMENTQNQELAIVTIREDENYVIVKTGDKYSRKAKYKDYSSIKAESRADKIWLMNLLDGDEDTGNGLKEQVGKQIIVADVITRKYDKVNEETGEMEYGVLTYLVTPDKQVFVTSSKSVYFSINKIMDVFGKPTDEIWENITVKVIKEKGTNGDMIKIKLVG